MTTDPNADTQPAISPNGNWIAFVSNRTGENDIYIMDIDGNGLENLTNSNSNDQWPTWSPDSNHIAFHSNREGENNEIYSMTIDGNNITNLTKNDADDIQPTWFEGKLFGFSTNQSIAFASNRENNSYEIYLMEENGATPTKLTDSPDSKDWQPAGAPAGDQIAFASDRSKNMEVYTMNIDGERVENITNNDEKDELPTWSPDNRYILFYIGGGESDPFWFYIYDTHTQKLLYLRTTRGIFPLAWLPALPRP